MPPTPFTATLTPEEKIVYQRERNRLKQQNLRARRAAAAADAAAAKEASPSSSSSSSGALPSTQAQRAMEELKAQQRQEKGKGKGVEKESEVVARMAKRLAELGEGEEEIGRLVEGRGNGGNEEEVRGREQKRVRMDPTSFSDFVASPSSAGGGGSTPSSSSASATPRSSASTSTASSSSSSSSKRLTSFNLFAALLNGSLPPPKPLHLLTSSALDSRALPIVAHPAFNRSALSSSSSSTHQSPFARELPSYSYASPVDLDIGRYPTVNPLQSVDWKIRLFQLHKAMHASRFHPTEGYMANPKLEETVAKAQLLILQLLGATSNQKARFDGRRVLSIEDQNYIDFAPMDPRLDWLPDPLVRVHTSKATSRGNVNLTDMTGQGIETAILYGDSWDFGAWAMSDHFHTPYKPYCVVAPLGFKCQGDKEHPPHSPGEGGFGQHVGLLGNHAGLRGSSVRDIVLGLEGPNWRTTEPVFTSVPEGLWEHTRYDESNPLHHEIAWRAGGAAEVHAAIIESWCKGEEGRLMVNELS